MSWRRIWANVDELIPQCQPRSSVPAGSARSWIQPNIQRFRVSGHCLEVHWTVLLSRIAFHLFFEDYFRHSSLTHVPLIRHWHTGHKKQYHNLKSAMCKIFQKEDGNPSWSLNFLLQLLCCQKEGNASLALPSQFSHHESSWKGWDSSGCSPDAISWDLDQ